MSNVQAAIKRNGVVVLLILLAALAVLLAGRALGRPRPASADPSVLPYQDASRPVDQRVADLLGRMTLAEKIGQMGQINVEVLQGSPDTPWDRGPLNPDLMADVLDKNQIGSILSGGGAWPPVGDDGKAWADEINTIQQFALDHSRLRIPIIYGADAVHGHNNLVDATMVPHQIGLGATFDPCAGRAAGPLDRERGPRHRRDLGLRARARHRARPALGALLRALRRGPGADRRDGRRHHPRPAGPQPGEPDLGRRHGQALRGLLGARQRLRPHRRHDRRQRAAEHPPAVVRAGHRRRRRDRDGQQRLGQRRAGARLAPHAHRHPARPAALQGRRDLRLAGRREPDHQVPRRHRHGGRDLAGRQRGPRHVDDPARRDRLHHQPDQGRRRREGHRGAHRPVGRAHPHAEVPPRPLRAPVRGRRRRQRGGREPGRPPAGPQGRAGEPRAPAQRRRRCRSPRTARGASSSRARPRTARPTSSAAGRSPGRARSTCRPTSRSPR